MTAKAFYGTEWAWGPQYITHPFKIIPDMAEVRNKMLGDDRLDLFVLKCVCTWFKCIICTILFVILSYFGRCLYLKPVQSPFY